MTIEGETKPTKEEAVTRQIHSLSIQERFNIEGSCIDFGAQFCAFWAVNTGIVTAIYSLSQGEAPLIIAVKTMVIVGMGGTVGTYVGGGLGLLASHIYLSRKN